jgi:hypothetical protein
MSDIDTFMDFLEHEQNEQRKFPRKDVDIKIKFTKQVEGSMTQDDRLPESVDKIVNISRNGVGVQTMRKFFVNDIVNIESQSDKTRFELKLRNRRLCGREGDYFIYGCEIIAKNY